MAAHTGSDHPEKAYRLNCYDAYSACSRIPSTTKVSEGICVDTEASELAIAAAGYAQMTFILPNL
jgi:hypothetical protein